MNILKGASIDCDRNKRKHTGDFTCFVNPRNKDNINDVIYTASWKNDLVDADMAKKVKVVKVVAEHQYRDIKLPKNPLGEEDLVLEEGTNMIYLKSEVKKKSKQALAQLVTLPNGKRGLDIFKK